MTYIATQNTLELGTIYKLTDGFRIITKRHNKKGEILKYRVLSYISFVIDLLPVD